MIDSSIGGKNGINHIKGKNMIGTFYQPSYTFIDSNFLKSIPRRELISGLGEAIKYAIILDGELFEFISNNLDDIISLSNFTLINQIIKQCIKLKVNIIENDPYDYNQRRVLNFGHTIGHALETFYGFDVLRHGEAIAYGMIAAGHLSIEYARLKATEFQILEKVIKKLPLPKLSNLNTKEILHIIHNDKKNKVGDIYFVLLNSFGHTTIVNNVKENSTIKVLENL